MSREVLTIAPDRPLIEVARLMSTRGFGAVPVCPSGFPQAAPIGIVTDRDIVVRVIAEDLDPEEVEVGKVMTSPVIYCFEDESPWVALHLMAQHYIRRLPVLDREKQILRGLLSITDLSQIQQFRNDHSPQWSSFY
ncbi:MAG: CBS domain-containing protein [Bdellovibrionales bacterium]|nr:CBS domain-containing protein [Bdellovibrionales bacterium]